MFFRLSFITIIISTILLLNPISAADCTTTNTSDNAPTVTTADPRSLGKVDRKLLSEMVERYVNFLTQFGQEDAGDIDATMLTTFTADCKKIANGKTVANSMREIKEQVGAVKAEVKTWEVKIQEPVLFVTENNVAVVRLLIPTTKETIIVTKHLYGNDKGLVAKIDEVFNTIS